jgi:uncharacterized membrane protein YfcA
MDAGHLARPFARRQAGEARSMILEPQLVVAGLAVGIIVGLTGMGGGALMTPLLVFFGGIDPLTAISSDVVVSLFMKPAAAFVHLRRGTVHLGLVGWLCVGSVPAAFMGAWFVGQMAPVGMEAQLKQLLGIALLAATAGLGVRAVLQMWRARLPLGEGPAEEVYPAAVVRPIPLMILGAVAGFMVGVTSIGAGSIIIVALLLLYPALKASSLVGTDLAQAIPLVAAAAVGHLLFGSFSLVIAGSLLVGAIPGAWLGAHVSSRAPGGLIRRVLAILLLASGLKLLGVPDEWVLAAVGATIVLGGVAWVVIRDRTARAAGGADGPRVDAPAA